jgi:hypothetical protein
MVESSASPSMRAVARSVIIKSIRSYFNGALVSDEDP